MTAKLVLAAFGLLLLAACGDYKPYPNGVGSIQPYGWDRTKQP